MSALLFVLRFTCCCCCWFTCIVILLRANCNATELIGNYSSIDINKIDTRQRRSELSRAIDNDYQEHQQELVTTQSKDTVYDDDTDMSYDGDDDEDYNETNTTEKGSYVGAPCENTCNADLQHVICDAVTGLCECERQYPVRLGPTRGCAKPKRLGEQCFYRATCVFTDSHATCAQVQHNAVCDCEKGYHRVAITRPNKKAFCAEDLVLITADMPTLLGIASGIAVITGLICFVLKLFSRARYTRPRHYADANHAPAMLFSSDTGIPLTLSGRPSSRSSQRSEGGTINCGTFGRRPSSGTSRGAVVPASRAGAARAAAILLISCHLQAEKKGGNAGNAGNKHRRALSDVAEGSSDGLGSRRPSLVSIHSSASSARSYSARRLERERNEKEQRQALHELKLAKLRDNESSSLQQQTPMQNAPTPSPRTPHSTDELLPAVDEDKEAFDNEVATTSGMTHVTSPIRTSVKVATTAVYASPSIITNNFGNANETAFNTLDMYSPPCYNDSNVDVGGSCSEAVDIFEC